MNPDKNNNSKTMKMVIAVVHDHDASSLMDSLRQEEFQATKMASTGGFLREGNTTFMIGTDEKHLQKVLDIIKENCKAREKMIAPMSPMADALESYYTLPMKVEVGGASVFIMDIEKFMKL